MSAELAGPVPAQHEPAIYGIGDRRSLLEAAIQALPVGVVLCDEAGECVLANPAAHRLGMLGESGPERRPRHIPAEGYPEGGPKVEADRREIVCGPDAYSLTTLVDVSRHHEIQRALLERAYIDHLTNLPNRSLVEQAVEDLVAVSGPDDRFALAFIDLDNFKHINDFYSHAVGDGLLTRIAARIGGMLRPSDMLARVGGDEFVLLLTPAPDAEASHIFLVEVAEALKQPFFIDEHEIFASASIGVSLFPDHGDGYDTLRRNADSAMYRVKGGVKGGVKLYEESMSRAATARMAIEQRLRHAIRDRCFCCAYQPKVDIRSGEVHGVEVLLRWRDDKGDIQAPGDFVNLAVELGLINEITREVVAEVVRSLPDIDDLFGPGTTISINIAAKQACDLPFMSSFVQSLAVTGLAERLVIELTEEAFLAKGRFQVSVLPLIRAAGAKVSIDDFGVGYSSLAALAEITADEIKIDRSFITDIHRRPRSQIVLKAIESLARALGMAIVAEGVETFEEVAYLQAASEIRCAQGYYYARPMLIEQLRGFAEPFPARASALQRQPTQLRNRSAARSA